MPVSVTHSTAADSTFSAAGKAAWDAGHTVSGLEWLGEYTFANLPAAASNSGKTATVTDVGRGALWRSDGTRWAPEVGLLALKHLGASVSGVGSSETIILQALIPAGAWQTNDIIRVWLGMAKSGSTDSQNVSVRIGTAGTTADTAIISDTSLLGAASRTGGWTQDIKLISATSVQRQGSSNVLGSWASSSGGAQASAVAISSAAANALYVSISIRSSGATDTVGSGVARIELLTP